MLGPEPREPLCGYNAGLWGQIVNGTGALCGDRSLKDGGGIQEERLARYVQAKANDLSLFPLPLLGSEFIVSCLFLLRR